MSAFLYGLFMQWKIDIRNKEALLLYYAAPLLVYVLIGGVLSSLMQDALQTNLIEVMCIFTISMGALLGAGASLCKIYGSDIRKAYQVGNIPLFIPFLQNLISAFIHINIMSTIIIISAPFLFDAQMPRNVIIFISLVMLYSLLCILISSLLGLYFLNENKMMMAAQCIFMPSLLLSGIMVPVESLNDSLQMVSKILPAHWTFMVMKGVEGNEQFILFIVGTIFACFLLCIWRVKTLSKLN